ncbi:reverse transcriptase domain-containing protein [Tanacetum coccineum]
MRFPPSDEDTCHSADIIDLSILDNIKEILPLNHVNLIEPILDYLPAIHKDCNNPALFTANTNDEEKPTPKLKELPSHLEYAFLDDNRELPVITLHYYLTRKKITIGDDQEKTNFTCPYGTFAYRRMPFGLCNAPATFQRCMTSIFNDMCKDFTEVFMDDFSMFGNSFETCLSNLSKMLARCEETNLVLNWEKCHFMVKEGIVLGHKISKAGIKVDKAKVDVIASLPYPTNFKGIQSFLGHVGFYRRFIKDFSKIARPMTQLLMKDAKFDFSDECIKSFDILQVKLITALVIIAPNWDIDFELMCDVSDSTVGAEFTSEIKDKKKTENLAADHLSRLENRGLVELNEDTIQDNFLDEHLMVIKLKDTETDPWTAYKTPIGKHRFLQLNQLDKFWMKAYEHSRAYKERTKRWHDSKIMDKEFQEGEEVLVFNSRLKLFLGKLRTRWYGSYTVSKVYSYGTVEVLGKNGVRFKVNGHRLKKYHGHEIDEINETIYFVKT